MAITVGDRWLCKLAEPLDAGSRASRRTFWRADMRVLTSIRTGRRVRLRLAWGVRSRF